MTDRLAELGALQWAVENLATAGTNPNRLGLAGYIHAAYTDYQTWAAANPGVNPNRLSARGRLYGYFYDYGFSPLSLFASGEQGAWFDPSDLSTMFQDSAGTTPVTADGQPVGLILDKSKGLAETVIPAPQDLTQWVSGGAFNSWAGTTATVDTITTTGGAGSRRYRFSVLPGETVKFSALTEPLTGENGWLQIAWGTSAFTYISEAWNLSSSLQKQLIATAPSNAAYCELCVRVAGSAGESAKFTNIVAAKIAGNHASQATAAKRPLYKTAGLAKYNDYDVVDDVLNTTFPASLGSSCTVAKAVVGGSPTILTAQTIGTTWAESTDNAALIIIDRALTSQETTDLTAWLTAKGATA